jgi:signal transduction histidine kinase
VTALPDSSESALVVHRNISKERWAEQAIRELGGKLIRAQEEERSRIARELHDDISQQLALLGVHLRSIRNAGLPQVDLERACRAIDDISHDVHQLSHHLHSTKLDHLGLVPALRGLCRELSEQYSISIESRVHEVPVALDKEAALNLYRVAQEALYNAVKHGNTKRGCVELTGSSHELVLRITDEGDGFNLGSTDSYRGLGLISMQERMHSIGGVLIICSTLSKGTQVEARLPLQKQLSGSGRFTHSAA